MSVSEDCCSSPSLISVDDAITRILEPTTGLEQTERLGIENALGRVLAEDVSSTINVPGYDNSAMDGYAVRSADCVEAGAKLRVVQRIPAGQVGSQLAVGTAARIFTGAPVPPDADAVVMQEHCGRDGDQVIINKSVNAGQHIRRAGEDISKGSVVLKAGHKLRPQELGLLASVGMAEVHVTRKLKVATFFTGDEIIEPGNKLGDGQIYNSNKYTVKGLLQETGCEILDLGIVPDTLEATLEVLKQASSEADLVVTSGGVSVGEEDYVRIALEQLGELKMWRIAMKPGKPVAYGKVGNAIFMGLPGNPVSTFVTFLLFVKPLILKLQGADKYFPIKMPVISDFEWPSVKRQEYLRVRLLESDKGLLATLYPHQGSGVLSSACWADGLVEAMPDQAIKKGDAVNYLYFS
ncbi:MAG: molybdopterin molybdotransferase MoeA [Gammaproteobacteria bacterium]|nr:molybdopterin molybdotransferase MoeA [Gammaproteobacteria bacterium]